MGSCFYFCWKVWWLDLLERVWIYNCLFFVNNKLHTLQAMHLPFGFPSYSSAQTIFLHAKEMACSIFGPVATMVVLQPDCFMQGCHILQLMATKCMCCSLHSFLHEKTTHICHVQQQQVYNITDTPTWHADSALLIHSTASAYKTDYICYAL